jgi:hypothetical protein
MGIQRSVPRENSVETFGPPTLTVDQYNLYVRNRARSCTARQIESLMHLLLSRDRTNLAPRLIRVHRMSRRKSTFLSCEPQSAFGPMYGYIYFSCVLYYYN